MGIGQRDGEEGVWSEILGLGDEEEGGFGDGVGSSADMEVWGGRLIGGGCDILVRDSSRGLDWFTQWRRL